MLDCTEEQQRPLEFVTQSQKQVLTEGEGAHRTKQGEKCYLEWREAGHDHLVDSRVPILYSPKI